MKIMIQTIGLQTSIQFGKGEAGTVGLSSRRGSLTIQQLINDIKIGDPFDPKKDVSELPKVILEFNEISSVDSLIDCLKKVKEFMQEPDPMAFAYAC